VGIFEDAHAFVLLADYIGVDAGGKINAIGAAFALTGVQQTGFTPPQYVAAIIDVPGKYAGQEFAASFELRDETAGTVVQMPGPSGQLESLRIQQVAKAERPQIPGVYLPEVMFCRVHMVLAFPNGLPLAPACMYQWRLQIDGQYRSNWQVSFYVPGPPPPPVFGGPAGPSDLPQMPSL
jgi:hypothetical protein